MSLIFDKIVRLAQDKGFIRRGTRQRIDATHILSHVNRISTTDLLFRAVRCVVEEIEKKDPAYYGKEVSEHIKERYSNSFSSFGLSKEKRGEKQAEIVEDGLYLKTLLEKVPSERLGEMTQLSIMETIFNENVKIRKKEIKDKVFIEVEEIEGPKQTIFNPRDPSIKLGIKGKKSWVGSKCHVVETAEKGKINFVTDMIYQKSNEDDSQIHEKIKEGNTHRGLHPKKLYADSSYISGGAIREYSTKGQTLMGYIRGGTEKKPAGFKLADFSIDMNTMKATCPAGHESEKSSMEKDGKTRIYFSRQSCKECSFFNACVGTHTRNTKRRLCVSPNYEYIRARREEQRTHPFIDEMRVRAQVEGTISEATRFLGFRYAKYKGEAGHTLQFYLTGAALNVKRLIRAITKGVDLVQMAKA
jgi:transposase